MKSPLPSELLGMPLPEAEGTKQVRSTLKRIMKIMNRESEYLQKEEGSERHGVNREGTLSLTLLRGRGRRPGAGTGAARGAGEGDCSEKEGTGVLLSDYRGYPRKGRLLSDGELTGDFWQWFQ